MENHCTPIKMVKIPDTDKTECWQGCGATGISLLVGMQNGMSTLKDSFGSFLQITSYKKPPRIHEFILTYINE